MNVVSIIIISVLGILVTWLLVDTIIAVIKKIKARKKDVEPKE